MKIEKWSRSLAISCQAIQTKLVFYFYWKKLISGWIFSNISHNCRLTDSHHSCFAFIWLPKRQLTKHCVFRPWTNFCHHHYFILWLVAKGRRREGRVHTDDEPKQSFAIHACFVDKQLRAALIIVITSMKKSIAQTQSSSNNTEPQAKCHRQGRRFNSNPINDFKYCIEFFFSIPDRKDNNQSRQIFGIVR